MLPNTRFNTGADNGTGGDTHSLSRSVPAAGGFGAGTMAFGDLIVLQAVGGSAAGGLSLPVVSDDITGATGWTKIADSAAYSTDFRSTWWWKRCVGGESSITVDWTTLGTQRGIVAAFVRSPGLLDEAYLIGQGSPSFNPPNLELGPLNPSGNRQMYIGGTAMGPFSYSFASIFNPPGTYDLNGVGGDGFNAGGSDGVAGIMHINTNVPVNLATDALIYQSQPPGHDTWDAWVGLRASCVQTESIDLFGNWHYGGGPPDGVDVSVSFSACAAGDQIILIAGGLDGDYATTPTIADNISGGTGWVADSDALYGVGADEFRGTVYRKTAVGGETALTVSWIGSTNKTVVGGVVRGLGVGATPYIIDQGVGPYIGGVSNIFQAAPGTVSGNGEVYLGLTLIGRNSGGGGPATDSVYPPRSTDASGMVQNSFGGLASYAFSWADTCDNLATDQLEIVSTGPNLPFFVIFYGFGSGAPSEALSGGLDVLEIAGTLGVTGGLAPITADLDVLQLRGALTVVPPTFIAGELPLLEARGALDIVGGEIQPQANVPILRMRGRLQTTGRPPPVYTPARVLGCGVYEVLAFTRGGGEVLGQLEFDSLTWARELDATSRASLTIDGQSNTGALARCCALLGELNPLEHEIGIYREVPGTSVKRRVWSGPITRMRFPSEQVIIEAFDLSGWLTIRTLHANHNYVNKDLMEMWVGWVEDAMSVDNSPGLYPHVIAPSGILGNRLTTIVEHSYAADAIAEIATTGIDWTTIDRVMQAGPVLPQPPGPVGGGGLRPLLIDESFRVAPEIIVDGLDGANCWIVNGTGSGVISLAGMYGPHFPAEPDHVDQPAAPDYAAIELKYGRIERTVNETRILDQASIDQAARTRYDLGKRLMPYITGGSLIESAPLPIEQIIPGSLLDVQLERACKPISATMRLRSLAVSANNDGSEDVDIGLEPIGTVA